MYEYLQSVTEVSIKIMMMNDGVFFSIQMLPFINKTYEIATFRLNQHVLCQESLLCNFVVGGESKESC